MFARYPGISRNLTAVCAAVLVLAAVSFPADPAHGFGLKLTWEDGIKAATEDLNAVGEEELEGGRKTIAQQRLERELDRETGNVAGKTAGKIGEYSLKAGKKVYGWLAKTKTFGPAAKKLARRYGAVVKKGLRLSPHVGKAVDAWDLGYAIGSKLIAPAIALPLIDRYFDGKSEEQQAQLREEIAHLRDQGEQRRENKKLVLSIYAAGLAVIKLREDERGSDAPGNRWGGSGQDRPNFEQSYKEVLEITQGSGTRSASDAADPRKEDDPWASKAPLVGFGRSNDGLAVSRAVTTKESEDGRSDYEAALRALQGDGAQAASGGTVDPWKKDDPWMSEARSAGFGRSNAELAGPHAVSIEESEDGYEAVPETPRSGDPESTGYAKALERLEVDHRAEQARREAEAEAARQRQAARAAQERRTDQARRKAEAEATRQRQAARAAEERRQRAERDAAVRREAAARERDRQEVYERTARERREYSTRGYNNSLQELNRNMRMLQQTRQKQQRAYRQQKALELRRERQQQQARERQLEIIRRQQDRERQTYQPYRPGGNSDCPPGTGRGCGGPCVPLATIKSVC